MLNQILSDMADGGIMKMLQAIPLLLLIFLTGFLFMFI